MTPDTSLAAVAIGTALGTALVTACWLLRAKPVPWWQPPADPVTLEAASVAAAVRDQHPIDRVFADLGVTVPDGPVFPLPAPAPTPAAPDPFAAPCDCGPPLPPLPPGVQLVARLAVPLPAVLSAGPTVIDVYGPLSVIRPICAFASCSAPRPLLGTYCALHAAPALGVAPDAARN